MCWWDSVAGAISLALIMNLLSRKNPRSRAVGSPPAPGRRGAGEILRVGTHYHKEVTSIRSIADLGINILKSFTAGANGLTI
jgi:hypothetical protein